MIKITTVIVGTLLIYLFYALTAFVLVLFRRNHIHWKNRCLRFWGAFAAAAFSVQIETEGNRPEPPFFIVSNHLSYIDIIVYYATLNTTFVSKAEVKEWPILGIIARTIGVLFINREKRSDVVRVNEQISREFNRGHGILLFPEGTTSAGTTLLPFRPSLLEIPATHDIPVCYSVLRYRLQGKGPDSQELVAWYGDARLDKHMFRLAREKNIIATIRFSNEAVHKRDRKELAATLHDAMMQLHHGSQSTPTA